MLPPRPSLGPARTGTAPAVPGIEDWVGRDVADARGPYGRIEELFVGRRSGRPEFAIVDIGDRRVAVPLHGAALTGEIVTLGVRREDVATAPSVQGVVDEIPLEVGDRILAQFGLEPGAAPLPEPAEADAAGDGAEVTLSEERLAIRKERLPTERVRFRKHVVSEEVTLTVTVEREELVIEREPLAAGEPAGAAPALGDDRDAAEFVLYAEEPVVERRVVPVERVRVRRGEITETRQIVDEVRREHLDVEQTPIEEDIR